MTGQGPDPELLREVATALRWAAHGGAEHVRRPQSSQTGPQPDKPNQPAGRLRLRDRPRIVGAPPTGAPAKAPAKAPGNLAAIRERLGDCQRCPLHAGRKQIVFGSGPPTARLMIIGDGPGAQEDAAGTLWQGEAGDLLDRMLAAMGLARDQVYLCSTVMCRLPDAEAPPAEALKACTPFLRSQLVTLRPEAVLVLGESAARFLTRSQAPIGALRGNWWQLVDWPAMSSHGLDQVLATPALKREVWGDLQQVMARLGLKRG